MKKTKIRLVSCLLAVALCCAALTATAFASGGDYYDELNGDAISAAPEPTPETPEERDATESVSIEDAAALLSSLLGPQAEVTAADGSIQITASEEAAPPQTGTVTTNGGNLNVRTGAGLDNTAFTQLPNGTEVEVLGTENGWVKIRLPEREEYVCGDYLTIHTAESGEEGFSLSLNEDVLAALLGLLGSGAENGSGEALTPDGNLTLVDDIGGTGSGKQFITLQSKNGNTFYLIIDRDDEGAETVHFLNQVDESDLLALTEDGEIEPEVCTCTDKCTAGAVNTSCPVCAVNMAECAGEEPEPVPEETPEDEAEPETSGGTGILLVFLLLAAAGGGAAYYFLKIKKNKPQTKGDSDLDDYDYGEDDEDGEEDALNEDYMSEEEAEEDGEK